MGPGCRGAYQAPLPARYYKDMMTLSPLHDETHRKAVASAISRVLSPAELVMVHNCWAAENPGKSAPDAFAVLRWVRQNMPAAAERLDIELYPAD